MDEAVYIQMLKQVFGFVTVIKENQGIYYIIFKNNKNGDISFS